MKLIHPDRHWSPETMTVGELIAELQKYDPELPVVAEWEGTWNGVAADRFGLTPHNGRTLLMIDVENH